MTIKPKTRPAREGQPAKKPSAVAMGRAAKGQREQSKANEAMRNALSMTENQRYGGPGAPAQYGNLPKPGGKSRKLTAEQAVKERNYATYGTKADAAKKIRADKKQSKEGRR